MSYDNGKQSEIGSPSNWSLILEYITILAEVRTISIYHLYYDIWIWHKFTNQPDFQRELL